LGGSAGVAEVAGSNPFGCRLFQFLFNCQLRFSAFTLESS
jgi:hypothetical protein